MIKVENLSRRFGLRWAVESVSFTVAPGEIVGFLGPNGAGKTTTLRVLAGYLAPTRGRVSVAGYDVVDAALEARRQVGYMPENVPLYPDLRVIEYLRFRGRLKGLHGRRLRQRCDQVIARCGLGEARRQIVGRLSKGYRQRVGLADALLHDPPLVILDEPTIGLDPNQIREVRELIRALAPAHTVMLSSHILAEVESVCSRVLIINRGRLVAGDTPANLRGLLRGGQRLRAELRGDAAGVVSERLRALPGIAVVGVETHDDGWLRVRCESEPGADRREDVFRCAAANGWSLRELAAEPTHLEDVFVSLTRPAGGGLNA